ncbi:hypothetical protein C0J52_16489 [Blattella germanica]|nr:hypothetical protein C0J52_16489 [Blattella germanica]
MLQIFQLYHFHCVYTICTVYVYNQCVTVFQVANKAAPPPHRCRTPSPIIGPGIGEGSRQRKRSPSIPRSRPSSPGSAPVRRPPSPGALDPAIIEAVKARVRRVQQARLYLLQQTGPNSFLVGGDSPEHKYRVVIGPQTCSCGRGPHCLHLLFVMLRVFQVPESDSRVYAKELKNFEVEALFRNYLERRNSRVNIASDDVRKDTPHTNGLTTEPMFPSNISSRITIEIFLLIGAEECYNQTESVLCPLCRHPWISEMGNTQTERHSAEDPADNQRITTHQHQKDDVDASTFGQKISTTAALQSKKSQPKTPEQKRSPLSSSSSDNSSSSGYKSALDSPYPIIPPEQMVVASEWMKVFGSDLVSCLYSRDWKVREMAIRRLTTELVFSQLSDTELEKEQVLLCCAKILKMVVADPVFGVFLSCVRCFRVLLTYKKCDTKIQQEELQELVRPILKTLIVKCADQNRRTACLSVEVLVEFAKGQDGELALGRHVPEGSSSLGLDGLELVLDCALESWNFENISCQWLAGRLIILDHLIHAFPEEFWLKYVPLYPNESGYKLHNYNRLITIVEFAFKALRSSNTLVARLARRVFVVSSSLTAKERGVFKNVLEMLSSLDSNLQTCLKKRLQQAAIECVAQGQVPVCNYKKTKPNLAENVKPLQTDPSLAKSNFQESLSQSTMLKSLLSPTLVKSSKLMEVTRQSGPGRGPGTGPSPPRPRDLPLDLSKAKSKKPVKFQHLPSISPTQVSCRRWSSSGSKLLSLFTNKKPEDSLPTKPEMNGIYRDLSSPVNSANEHRQMAECSQRKYQKCFSSYGGLWSKVTTPTTPTAPHSTPVTDEEIPGHKVGTYDDVTEELVIPLNFSDLSNDFDVPAIPGRDWKRGHLLGMGGFSSCYQARDVTTGTLMAVKQVPFYRMTIEEQQKVELGIRKEIVTMSKLRHENIVRILGATKHGDHFNMFVEWMAGGSLASMLDKYGPFKEEVILRYTKQILEGLSYLHDNHILHRDLKGANLLVDSTGQHLRIADFGTAARLGTQKTIPGEFEGQVLGTVAFMAPEVLRGDAYGRSCDIWSVGCCIIEMASTHPPWKETCLSNHLALVFKIASSQNPPSIPASLSETTKDLALQCLQMNPELRPTAKELLQHDCFRGLQT